MESIDVGTVSPATLAKSSIKVGAIAGTGGLVVGAFGGVIRSQHPFIFSLFSGLQWFTLGSTFWFTRSFLVQETGQDPGRKPFVSSVAGGLSASINAALFRGRANILPGALMGGLAGLAGQYAFDAWIPTADLEAKPKMPVLERLMRSRWSPLEPLSSEDYSNMLKKKILRVDAELAIIEEDMTKLRDAEAAASPSRKD